MAELLVYYISKYELLVSRCLDHQAILNLKVGVNIYIYIYIYIHIYNLSRLLFKNYLTIFMTLHIHKERDKTT